MLKRILSTTLLAATVGASAVMLCPNSANAGCPEWQPRCWNNDVIPNLAYYVNYTYTLDY